ncbi:gamma-glutamyl-gamma-aminobutyrate hydrolase family protein [Verminephrobacter aporrectodeae subsp. tuberculatae]|uniref:Gamma-glutamyl-gamma-aminobutyrate hydrolase family protein n=1 Tax=Verminephrobacter aporrectodeae subsp. tuberculatae TaxID=1110392 RepID=A0ABT3KVI1_9BURK|nr:gamma-glutamyl-gamma-aminobutyrate hydrolase family protein [Verminephrobacter aporrectodeae subsp. tuberculatae]MCW5322285.1 gamma-glutamyl-gamma-aminobutyrate hydrolase family protein [Verminephrobacter aporrectodeae subsp. tuberculatae]
MVSNGSESHATASPAPLIGVTTYLEQAQTGVWDVRASFLPKVYLDAVTDAGAIALLLPPQPVTAQIARAVLAPLDGLIVTGGADVDPARYGQRSHERTTTPRTERDEWEAQLIRAARAMDLPLLGICRGMQLLNVTLGGTLVQHLPDRIGSDAYQPGAGQFGRATVTLEPDSALAVIFGNPEKGMAVPVYHHQAVDTVAGGLRVTAVTADGVIEAVECARMRFCIGVQWHPEENAEDRRIFAGLVRAARAYRTARHARNEEPAGHGA